MEEMGYMNIKDKKKDKVGVDISNYKVGLDEYILEKL